MMIRRIATSGGVIDAVGGTAAAAKLTGKSLQSVSNSRASNTLPGDTYLIYQAALKERGLTAPPELWGIKQPPQATRRGRA